MRRVPFVNLEFALIADGVPVDEVYAVLDTPAGLERAFRKLDTIKDQVVWWEAGAQPPQMLADGEVAMSTAYNGRIFNAQVLEGQPFEIVWDGQVLDVGPIGIVAGTPDLGPALELVKFATRASSMAAIGRYIAYSPVRRSGLPLIGRHADAGIDMNPHMPTYPAHMRRTLQNDWLWWSDNLDEMNERFSAWAGALTRPSLRAAGLALPLVAFIGVTFVVPLGTMLLRSVYDPVVADALPDTIALLREWGRRLRPRGGGVRRGGARAGAGA